MANQPTNVTTGQVRLSYVHLFQPYAAKQDQEPKYSATILLPKSDVATKQRIDAAIQAAIADGISSKWNGVRPPIINIPIHDGDGARPSDGMPFGEECKGHWIFTASSKQQQAIVDANIQPILNQTEVYSGMYARVNINFFAYSNSGKKGIGCGLGPIQKLADGEPLGGRMSAEAAFGGDQGGQPAPGYPQQGYQPPAQPQYAQPGQPAYPQPGYGQPAQPPAQPGYPQPGMAQPSVQPGYPQQPQTGYTAPAQPGYPQPQQLVQYDPITGAPIPPGGVMGI